MGKLAAVIIIVIIIIGGVIALTHKSNNNTTTPPANSSSTSSTTTTNQSAVAGTINIRDMMFTPSQITVPKGGTVKWTNNDTTTHTVVADLGNGPNSGDIAPGQTYSYTFTKSGSVQYHCSIHPSMRGTIVVK